MVLLIFGVRGSSLREENPHTKLPRANTYTAYVLHMSITCKKRVEQFVLGHVLDRWCRSNLTRRQVVVL